MALPIPVTIQDAIRRQQEGEPVYFGTMPLLGTPADRLNTTSPPLYLPAGYGIGMGELLMYPFFGGIGDTDDDGGGTPGDVSTEIVQGGIFDPSYLAVPGSEHEGDAGAAGVGAGAGGHEGLAETVDDPAMGLGALAAAVLGGPLGVLSYGITQAVQQARGKEPYGLSYSLGKTLANKLGLTTQAQVDAAAKDFQDYVNFASDFAGGGVSDAAAAGSTGVVGGQMGQMGFGSDFGAMAQAGEFASMGLTDEQLGALSTADAMGFGDFGGGSTGGTGGGSSAGTGGEPGTAGAGQTAGMDSSGEATDAGDGGGGDKIICTELVRQGLLDVRYLVAQRNHGKDIPLEVHMGYHHWARPIVKLMEKSPLATRITNVIAKPVYLTIAAKGGYGKTPFIIGPISYWAWYTISGYIGRRIKNKEVRYGTI